MDTSTALVHHVNRIFADLAGRDGDVPDGDLQRSLATLMDGLQRAVPSFCGLAITVVIDQQPVTLTAVRPGLNTSDITTSLRVSLSFMPSLDAGSQIIYYAAARGSLTDLASDLTLAGGDVGLRLDEDILPAPVAGLTGVPELSIINQAIGMLIAQGHNPESAREELIGRAQQVGIGLHEAAVDATTRR